MTDIYACSGKPLRRDCRHDGALAAIPGLSSQFGQMRLRNRGRGSRPTPETGDEHRNDADQKDAVEGSSAADGGDRRAQALHLSEIEQIRSEQRAQAAADVSERRRMLAR